MDKDPHYTKTYFVCVRNKIEVLFEDWYDARFESYQTAKSFCKSAIRNMTADSYVIWQVTISKMGEKKFGTLNRYYVTRNDKPLFGEWADAMKTRLQDAEKYSKAIIEHGRAKKVDIFIVTITPIDRKGVADVSIQSVYVTDIDPEEVRKRTRIW